jgi:hypothetical protein
LANPAKAKFCQECGASFGEAAEAKRTGGEQATDIRISSQHLVGEIPEGERKTVTALFADIKGSMELMEDLDPEEARAIVDPALKLMMDAVHHYGGYVAQSTGDGIFALFGAPIAHEDHPQRALYAARRLQDEMRRYSAKLRAVGNPPSDGNQIQRLPSEPSASSADERAAGALPFELAAKKLDVSDKKNRRGAASSMREGLRLP